MFNKKKCVDCRLIFDSLICKKTHASLFHADTETASSSEVHKDQVNPSLPTTQTTPDFEHYDQPAEGDDESEDDEQKQIGQEQMDKVDQSQAHDNNNGDVKDFQLQHQEEGEEEGEIPRKSTESEDTEQVETFFSTMSHRYENATQEAHIP